MVNNGVCLVSQELQELVNTGQIIVGKNFNDFNIQPSSFEPTIMDYLYVLDTETGVVRPDNEKVRRKLLGLTKRQRAKQDISNGYELKKGFSYLIPLEERVKLNERENVKFTPKSNIGRSFVHTRLFGDYNPCFDELSSQYVVDKELNLWLLAQPLVFNVIVHPGLSLNQARFFRGMDAKLSDTELLEQFEKNPFLFDRDDNGRLISTTPLVNNGLQLHLDLSGRFGNGVVGLRARDNPTPFDLNVNGGPSAEDYFEPLFADNGKLAVKRGEYLLLSSKEYLKIPRNLNAELESDHHASLKGKWHDAGFIDNGFTGGLVFEVMPEEDIVFEDGMPTSRLKVFRTGISSKLYGSEINSGFVDQKTVQPPKFFKGFDFEAAARTHEKLSREALVQDSHILLKYRKLGNGFEWITGSNAKKLLSETQNGFFHVRYDCEEDDEVLQLVPYTLVFNDKGEVFSYVRASDIKVYADTRLFGKHSIGLGGHVEREDEPDYIMNCLEREVLKKEIKIIGTHSNPKLVGTIYCDGEEVNKVHFGMVYTIKVDGEVEIGDEEAVSGRFVGIEELMNDPEVDANYEPWSRYLIPNLPGLYR